MTADRLRDAAPDVAWAVEMPGGGSEVFFAASIEDAWRQALEDQGCCDLSLGVGQCECLNIHAPERAPHFDQHAPGPVPLEAYHAAGWHWHCAECLDAGYGDEPTGDWEVVDGKAVCHECLRETGRWPIG